MMIIFIAYDNAYINYTIHKCFTHELNEHAEWEIRSYGKIAVMETWLP